MTSFQDLKDFLKSQDFKLIIAADAETRVTESSGKAGGKIVTKIPAGGVAISLDPIARASNAIYIGRGKTEEERKQAEVSDKMKIEDVDGGYILKRLFFSKAEIDSYYNGFANQTLWPLCHVSFERPEFRRSWYEGFKRVNQKFANAIKEEIKGKTFIWVNDYQLSLVPKFLGKPKNTIVAMFWHIPWPTWEAFRILPFKKEILESLLSCDFLAFHRGYHVRNFLDTAQRELEVRIDEETNKVYFDESVCTVKNLPMGIDTDVVQSLIENEEGSLANGLSLLFKKKRVILGVDRLDYTKGILLRLEAIDRFFSQNPKYLGKIIYLGIIAPSREAIPLYQDLRRQIDRLTETINRKFKRGGWRPILITYKVFPRKDIINFYKRSALCLVTPRDDGMNLVSKEFVLASSKAKNPGMLVLSRFAGSAIDLKAAIIVNPYDIEEMALAIKRGLEMPEAEKIERIKVMTKILEEKNVYEWAKEFIENAATAREERNPSS